MPARKQHRDPVLVAPGRGLGVWPLGTASLAAVRAKSGPARSLPLGTDGPVGSAAPALEVGNQRGPVRWNRV